MIALDVQIRDGATSPLRAVRDAYAAGRHLKVIAASGSNTVREHFRQLDRQRHRSAARFHFYSRAADATTPLVRGSSAIVRVDQEGIGLRVHGGTVRPRLAKYLAIPVDDIAIGRRPREFSGTEFRVNRSSGKGVITLGDRVLFALTRETVHLPDPSVLPDGEELLGAVSDDLRAWTDGLERRASDG